MAAKNQDTNNGKITLDRKILVSIINLAAKEINGVESVTNSSRPWYKRLFNRYDDGGCQHRKECGKKGDAGELSAREQGSGRGDCQTTAAAESLGNGSGGFYKSDIKIRGRGTA